eukprot:6201650-Pleurochrysis_carterae.AAC.2
MVAARARMGSGHLQIAWPVLRTYITTWNVLRLKQGCFKCFISRQARHRTFGCMRGILCNVCAVSRWHATSLGLKW